MSIEGLNGAFEAIGCLIKIAIFFFIAFVLTFIALWIL